MLLLPGWLLWSIKSENPPYHGGWTAVQGHKKLSSEQVQFRYSQGKRLDVPWKQNTHSSNTFLLPVRKHQPHQQYARTISIRNTESVNFVCSFWRSERELLACKYRIASGTAMKATGIMILLPSHSLVKTRTRNGGSPVRTTGRLDSYGAGQQPAVWWLPGKIQLLLPRDVEDKYGSKRKEREPCIWLPVPCT